jgi:hypothetical protein
MPTLASVKSDQTEATFMGVVVQGASTGQVRLVTQELPNYTYGKLPSMGLLRLKLEEDFVISGMDAATLIGSQWDMGTYSIFPKRAVFFWAGQAEGMPENYELTFPGIYPLEWSDHQTIADPILLDHGEVKGVASSISVKLRERIFQFETGRPGQESICPETRSSVNELVAWLCTKSDIVSATVSSDAMLSVATVFPKDVRLYVEIARDGRIEAAVTRERRYASDISGNTVADLTPEVILAAVKAISSI